MEQATRFQERSAELAGQVTGKGFESVSVWFDANQRLWREFLHMSAETAREQARLLAEAQSKTVEMMTAPLTGWVELQKEATGWYQKALRDGVESMQRAFDAMAENGERWVAGGARMWEGRAFRSRDVLKGQWGQLRSRLRQHWGKITDDELDQIQGDADALVGKLQEHYGRTREQIEHELDRWLAQQRFARAS